MKLMSLYVGDMFVTDKFYRSLTISFLQIMFYAP